MDREAFFISPAGNVICVPDKHINLVCARPELFNLTRDYLYSVFIKHHEDWDTEGLAREEIILGLLVENWIRIRIRTERNTGTVCVFQIHKVDKKTIGKISGFSRRITSDGVQGVTLSANTAAVIKLSNGVTVTDAWCTLKDCHVFFQR